MTPEEKAAKLLLRDEFVRLCRVHRNAWAAWQSAPAGDTEKLADYVKASFELTEFENTILAPAAVKGDF